MANVGAVNLGDPDGFGADTPFTLQATGLVSPAIRGSISIPALALSGSLQGPSRLPAFTLSGVVLDGRVGEGDAFLPDLVVSATALPGGAAVGSIRLPFPTLAASTGTRANNVLAPFSLTATGVVGQVSKGGRKTPTGQTINQTVLLLPSPTLSGAMRSQLLSTGDAQLQPAFLSASGIAGAASAGDAVLRAPTVRAASLTGQAPSGSASLPAFTLAATTADGTSASASLTLPALTLATAQQPQQPQPRTGTGDLTLAGALLSATMLPGGVGTAALVMREPTLSAELANSAIIAGSIQLAEFTLAGSGLASNAGAGVVVRLPEMALSAQAVTGTASSASIELPLMQLSARDGVMDVVGTATLRLPAFQLSALAQATVLASVEFTGIALNTRTKAVSEYAGLAPNSIASFQGVTLMATPDGIVALAGTDDLGQPIAAHILSPKTDLGLAGHKRVLTGYVGLRASGDLEMTLIADDHHEFVYQLQPLRLDEQHNTRAKFGRGIKGVYWQFKVANVDGADFALDRVELHTAATGDKV